MSSFVTLDNLDDFLPSFASGACCILALLSDRFFFLLNDPPFLLPITLQKRTFGALSLSYSCISCIEWKRKEQGNRKIR